MNHNCAIAGSGFSTPTIAFFAPYFNPPSLCRVGI
jgi:hypothetical protein